MTFFSKNLHDIKFFPEECYHVFSTKTNPGGASIHREKDFFHLKPPLVDFNFLNLNFYLSFQKFHRGKQIEINLQSNGHLVAKAQDIFQSDLTY